MIFKKTYTLFMTKPQENLRLHLQADLIHHRTCPFRHTDRLQGCRA